MELKDLRARIDEIDDETAKLIAERFEIVESVARAKAASGKAVRDVTREAEILERLGKSSENFGGEIREIYKCIFAVSRRNQEKMMIEMMKKSGEKAVALKVINGANLNMLGIREPEIYGKKNYGDLVEFIENSARELGIFVSVSQFNHEGDIVDEIQSCYELYDAIIINPGAYTHTSVAIADALKAVALPVVEVHLTDVDKREKFRKISFVSAIAVETVKGLGFDGYKKAMEILVNKALNTAN